MQLSLTYYRRSRSGPVAGNAKRLLSLVVRKTAFDIEAAAKGAAPVDTGALRASIYTSTPSSSSYAAAARGAQTLNDAAIQAGQTPKGAKPSALRVFPERRPEHDLEAIVGVGVNYGLYVELGTHRMRPRPYMEPAVEGQRRSFLSRCAEAIRRAAGG